MPPPKKPKNGPTTAEQFLSEEELKTLEKKEEKASPSTKNGAEPSQARAPRQGSSGHHGHASSQRSNHRSSRNSGAERNSGLDKGQERTGVDRNSGAERETVRERTTGSAGGGGGGGGGGGAAAAAACAGILRELFTKQQDDVRLPSSLHPDPPPTSRSGRPSKGATPHGYSSDSKPPASTRDAFLTHTTPHCGDHVQGTSAASRDTRVPCDAVSASSPISRPQATITSDTSSSSSSTSTSTTSLSTTFPQLWGSPSGPSQKLVDSARTSARKSAALAAVESGSGFRPAALVNLPPSDKATSASRTATSAAVLATGVSTASSHLPLFSASAKDPSPPPHSTAPGPHGPFDLSVRKGSSQHGKTSGSGRQPSSGKETSGERVKHQDSGLHHAGGSSSLSTFSVSQTLYLKSGGGQGFLYQGPTPGPLPPRGPYLSGDVTGEQALAAASVIGRATPNVMNILCGGRPIPSTSAAATAATERGGGQGGSEEGTSSQRPSFRHSLSSDSQASSKDSQLDSDSASPTEEGAGGPTIRSPQEEGRMVSPGSSVSLHPMLPSTPHMQAPSSTTPEATMETKYIPPSMDMVGLPDHPPQIKTEPRASGSGVPKLCQVCHDNASGFHYGVWSCEGCKAFFKRSIQGPVDYVCPATETCTIDKHRRKSCQACRLRKCVAVGMNKGSQRKTERKSSTAGTGGRKRCRADSTDSAVNSTSCSGPQAAGSSKAAKRARTSPIILDALLRSDMVPVESHHNPNTPATRVNLLSTLVKVADQELVLVINWAKQVPGYCELSLSDQVLLIERCWMELLLLNCAFRSKENKGKMLLFAQDFGLERPHWNTMGMEHILEQVSGLSEQMAEYNVTKEEMVLMQAMVLVNAGLQKNQQQRLASTAKLDEMRVTILEAFADTSQRQHGEDSSAHQYTLILLLTQLKMIAELCIGFFQELKQENIGVVFCDLLNEMLDVRRTGQRRRIMGEEQQSIRPNLQLH